MAALPTTQYKLLADAIPASSFAVAANELKILDSSRNFDMNVDFKDLIGLG
jgi:hypothetical protein